MKKEGEKNVSLFFVVAVLFVLDKYGCLSINVAIPVWVRWRWLSLNLRLLLLFFERMELDGVSLFTDQVKPKHQ